MNYRILLFLIAAALVFASCQKNDNQFKIRGVITHAEGKTIYLEELHTASGKLVGETKINKKGEFEFEGSVGIPTFYLLKLSENNYITLLVDSAENVVVEADAVSFHREYQVEGSNGSEQVRLLNEKLSSTRMKLDSLRSLDNLYKGNPDYDDVRPKWAKQFEEVMNNQIDFSTEFVRENPFSMASVVALYQRFNNNDPYYIIRDLQVMRTAASALHSIYPQSEQVQALYNNTLQFVRQQKAAQMQKFIEENGSNSPDITLPNPDGKEVSLSSLRGKVVLLQFWAAVNPDSRIQNEALVEAYKKYKRKGFEIYQVSLDRNRIEWVDAIDKDKLNWTNVGDMKGSVHATRVYNVQTLPFNYLLDKDGSILAKNLRGPALDKALKNVLK